ncbi:hypothetical protein GCM10027271_46450 [Saccharopolyspora gloriosae]|uniref:Uncharacterized protein n=1 Tax=Saccharopolyspora gloriosae TaxID=455344 RepID=A0A840NEM0_9PSEU|nr:hypothetical protein [Saccharopolyspora gloriosae]MBB5070054.1 hypothetical protein [Saccharopolyspora gloriosae]
MGEDDCTISLETLRQVFNEAINNLEERVGDVVELDEDFFWSVPREARYDPYSAPASEQLTLGQLTSSWNALKRMHATGEHMNEHTLVWVAEILQILGQPPR